MLITSSIAREKGQWLTRRYRSKGAGSPGSSFNTTAVKEWYGKPPYHNKRKGRANNPPVLKRRSSNVMSRSTDPTRLWIPCLILLLGWILLGAYRPKQKSGMEKPPYPNKRKGMTSNPPLLLKRRRSE